LKKEKRKKKKRKKKKKATTLFLPLLCLGRWWTVCWDLNGKTTTRLPFITGCLELSIQNHRVSIVWPKHLMPKLKF